VARCVVHVLLRWWMSRAGLESLAQETTVKQLLGFCSDWDCIAAAQSQKQVPAAARRNQMSLRQVEHEVQSPAVVAFPVDRTIGLVTLCMLSAAGADSAQPVPMPMPTPLKHWMFKSRWTGALESWFPTAAREDAQMKALGKLLQAMSMAGHGPALGKKTVAQFLKLVTMIKAPSRASMVFSILQLLVLVGLVGTGANQRLLLFAVLLQNHLFNARPPVFPLCLKSYNRVVETVFFDTPPDCREVALLHAIDLLEDARVKMLRQCCYASEPSKRQKLKDFASLWLNKLDLVCFGKKSPVNNQSAADHGPAGAQVGGAAAASGGAAARPAGDAARDGAHSSEPAGAGAGDDAGLSE